jgi:hypothetical protein
LREGESPVLPGEEREEGLGSLGRLFLYHFELGGGQTIMSSPGSSDLWAKGGTLDPRGGAVLDYP